MSLIGAVMGRRGPLAMVVAVVLPVTACALAPAAQAATAQTTSCINTVTTSVDWLRVHTQPSTSSPAVGQIPGGSCWYDVSAGVTGWRQGYGYNGSTKVSGWVVASYIQTAA